MKQNAAVLDCMGVAEASVIEAYPIGVIEDGCSFEGGSEQLGPIKVEWMNFDAVFKEMQWVRRISQRANLTSRRYQSCGNVTARISKGTCDDVQFIPLRLSPRLRPERCLCRKVARSQATAATTVRLTKARSSSHQSVPPVVRSQAELFLPILLLALRLAQRFGLLMASSRKRAICQW